MPTPISCRHSTPRLKPRGESRGASILRCPRRCVRPSRRSRRHAQTIARSARRAGASGACRGAPGCADDSHRLGLRRLRPIAAAPIRLGDIRPDADGLQIHHDLITVIALVRDQRGERLGVVHLGVRLLELVRRGDCRSPMVVVSPRSAPCTVTATIAPVSRSTDVRPCGPNASTIFHLRDLRIRIDGAPPVLVRCRLLPLLVQAGEVVARRGGNARSPAPSRSDRPGSPPRCPAARAPHRGVRLQRGRVDPDRRALDHARRDEALLHPGEHGAMRSTSTGAGFGRWSSGHRLAMPEAPNRQRVRRAPGCSHAFKVPDQQRAKIDRETRPATGGGIEPSSTNASKARSLAGWATAGAGLVATQTCASAHGHANGVRDGDRFEPVRP